MSRVNGLGSTIVGNDFGIATMKVFLSWSGQRSKKIAAVLRQFLPDIIQTIEPFMSEHDIKSGEDWGNRLDRELDDAVFGILCLTEMNLESSWLLFEAGALVKCRTGYACSLLIDGLSELRVPSPLRRYHFRRLDRDGLLKLVLDLNGLQTNNLPNDRVERAFDKFWPEIENACKETGQGEDNEMPPEARMPQMLDEIVSSVRRIEQSLGTNRRAPNIDHLYTTSTSERDAKTETGQYMVESIACYVFPDQKPGTIPLHRLRSLTRDDHFYTCWDTEVEHAIRNSGYTKEGIAGWVFDSEKAANTDAVVPLFRMYHEQHKDHFYTTSPQERDHATQACGYRLERTACFVFDSQEPGTAPLYRMISYAARKQP